MFETRQRKTKSKKQSTKVTNLIYFTRENIDTKLFEKKSKKEEREQDKSSQSELSSSLLSFV